MTKKSKNWGSLWKSKPALIKSPWAKEYYHWGFASHGCVRSQVERLNPLPPQSPLEKSHHAPCKYRTLAYAIPFFAQAHVVWVCLKILADPQKNGRKFRGKWCTTGCSSFPPENVQTKSLLIFLDPQMSRFLRCQLYPRPSSTTKPDGQAFLGQIWWCPHYFKELVHDWGTAPRILRVSFIPSVFVKIDWPFYVFWQATLKACLDNRKLERNHHAQCGQFDHGWPVDRMNFCGRSPRFWWTCEVFFVIFLISKLLVGSLW